VERPFRDEPDLDGLPLGVDGSGLPIHGLLVGWPGWTVEQLAVRADSARLRASTVIDAPAFPFPHRIVVTAIARDHELGIDTTVVPTGRREVPVSFGWHPYLRLPGSPRGRWHLRLPPRGHLALDSRGIPTGVVVTEAREWAPIGRRTFDDGYRLGRDRRLGIESDTGKSVALHCGSRYRFAQVWVPRGQPFVALEPMAAPTNALVERTAPLVEPGDTFTTTFRLTLDRPN
jgi:aldose 1-epimerase